MRVITKGAEPPSLTVHRQKTHSNYENYPDKDALRQALVTEQRGLCCYCMERIHNDPQTMKIEHWRCQSRFPDEQLIYRNMLGTCMGGEDQPPALQHCDKRKCNIDLRWNPAEPNHHIETRIYYELDGSIRSDEPGFNTELNEVLNLNLPLLKRNRTVMLDAVLGWWKLEKHRRPMTRARLERERNRRLAGNGNLEPFCQVVVWWLDQKLARIPV